jgi:hypothetical protein
MADTVGPSDPLGGEYTDSELPLDAALPKEEYEQVEELIEAAGEADDDELDDDLEVDTDVDADSDIDTDTDTAVTEVDVIEIVEPDAVIRPARQPPV